MSDAAFEANLRDEPLSYKMPCAGCQHLREQSGSYVWCGFPIPDLPLWFEPSAQAALRGQFTRKEVFGPFTADASVRGCATVKP